MAALSLVEGNDTENLERGEWTSDDIEGNDNVETKEKTSHHVGGDGDKVLEPYEGMEFEFEADAKRFYKEYAERLGFVVHLMQRQRSEVDDKTLARYLSCTKNGHCPNTKVNGEQEKKSEANESKGCNAKILVRLEKSGKWVVKKFVKEHNHPLVVKHHDHTNGPGKSKKIEKLARDLQRHEEMNAMYRDGLVNLLANIENRSLHVNSNVLAVVQNVRQAEAEALTMVSKG